MWGKKNPNKKTYPEQSSGCKYRTWCWYLSSCCYGLCFLLKKTVKMFIFRQSAELNKLRQDYARLVNELGEKSSKLQQEELQKKNAEQAVAQLKVTWVFPACRVALKALFIWAKFWIRWDVRCVRIALAVALATKCLHLLQMCKCLFSVRLSQPVGLIFFIQYSGFWVITNLPMKWNLPFQVSIFKKLNWWCWTLLSMSVQFQQELIFWSCSSRWHGPCEIFFF